MSAFNNTITMEQGAYNEAEIARLHSLMNARALRKKRIRKTVLVAVNIIFALFMQIVNLMLQLYFSMILGSLLGGFVGGLLY